MTWADVLVLVCAFAAWRRASRCHECDGRGTVPLRDFDRWVPCPRCTP